MTDFRGFDMLAEPEPYPPAFVREWERRLAPPKPSLLAAFDSVMREAFKDTMRLMNSHSFLIPLKYGTPPEQQARYELRQAQRKARRV